MKKSTLRWVIALMSLSLVGLIGFQLYWIDTVIKANEERFTKDVLQAMNNVALKLEKQETVAALHKFQSVNDLKPNFNKNKFRRRPRPVPGPKSNGPNGQREGAFVFNRQQQPRQHIVVMDTLMADGFQVVFNYEFMGITPYGRPGQPGDFWESATTGESELELELEEKQSVIEQLEDQVAWYSRKYELVTRVMDDLLAPGRKLANRFSPDQLDSLLGTELKDKGIKLPYDYGVFAPRFDRFVFVNESVDEEALIKSDLKASLFPNDLTGSRAQLVLDFPGKSRYLLEKIWLTMISSGVLVAIIVFCFGYSIKTILRQKKLSLMKNDFINNMTHEFKTPIATVSLATEALQDKDISQSEAMSRRYIRMIQDENHRLGSQVERVLQIAAIEKQDFSLVKEELDMHELIRTLVDNMQIQVESRGGRITTILNAAIAEIKGDETHITNCILNLLDNANKYSPEAPNIIVRTESTHESLIISVQDHGMGMSRETQKHVFEKFYRLPTGNRHDVKGFGLGLSYVKNMIEAHHGDVSVESTIGKGSKFTITLPLN